jgi:hypothetical protein
VRQVHRVKSHDFSVIRKKGKVLSSEASLLFVTFMKQAESKLTSQQRRENARNKRKELLSLISLNGSRKGWACVLHNNAG